MSYEKARIFMVVVYRSIKVIHGTSGCVLSTIGIIDGLGWRLGKSAREDDGLGEGRAAASGAEDGC